MIQPLRVEFCAHEPITFSLDLEGVFKEFPLLSIDSDSYIDGSEIHSRADFPPYDGRHCITIGKSCSLAREIKFMVDMNHDYLSVTTGAVAGEIASACDMKAPRKGSIIIQNDVWIGYNATLMSSIALGNGSVVAAGSVVTKDVPPYAIVGGNPAKIIRYRFDKEIIDNLQKIAWWDWSEDLKAKRRADFNLPVSKFVNKYLPEAEKKMSLNAADKPKNDKKHILFFPDLTEPFPLYPDVLRQYFEQTRPDALLIIYLTDENMNEQAVLSLECELQKYKDKLNSVKVEAGANSDEAMQIFNADYYITTRGINTVKRTCLAEFYNTKILYETDMPIFGERY